VAEATVAVEDRRFYDHGALDVRSLARVAWWTVTGRAQDPGGATITLQLARVLFGRGQVRDLALAFKLQDRFSRERILELYLDSVYYGHAARGIQAASRTYFGTSVRRLTWAQASLLAGLPQAPSAYDPLEHLALARRRQREVLDALVATGALTRARALRVSAEPLRLRGAPARALQHPSRRRGPAAVAADTAPPTRSKAR
jgi:penicillin-binding protein 1A